MGVVLPDMLHLTDGFISRGGVIGVGPFADRGYLGIFRTRFQRQRRWRADRFDPCFAPSVRTTALINSFTRRAEELHCRRSDAVQCINLRTARLRKSRLCIDDVDLRGDLRFESKPSLLDF